LWPSEEASSWSQMPVWCRSARRCLSSSVHKAQNSMLKACIHS